jgi:phage/plasmid-like protein (TIGR03299 family)
MSRETMIDLNRNVLVGYGVTPWQYEATLQGDESMLYSGAIPVADVNRRLFGWQAKPRRVAVEIPCSVAEMTHLSDAGVPMKWTVQVDRQAIARSDDDTVMGMFKDGYQPHQYSEWLIGTVSAILGDTLGIGSAGLLKGGAVAWVQVETPETHTNPQGVAFRPRLLGGTSFDGSIATFWKKVFGIVVCDNTMEAARAEDGAIYKIKHTRNSGFKLNDARTALGIVEQSIDEFDAQIAALCETAVTDRQFGQFLEALAPTTEKNAPKTGRVLTLAVNKQGDLRKLWIHDNRVSPWRNTAFGVVQAVNTWTHHLQTVRGAERAERNMLNAITGATAKSDDETLGLLSKILAA